MKFYIEQVFKTKIAIFLYFLLNVSVVCAANIESSSTKDNTHRQIETFIYKQVDNLEIKADVYTYQSDKPQPVILWIHGGALIMGSRKGPLPAVNQLEEYLRAGYVLVSIDYRLAPETKLKEIVEDVEDAYAWIRGSGPELFNIDPDRIAVMGMSAGGGYLTLTAGFRLIPAPQALVSFYGYGDITGEWYSQPYTFYRETRPLVSRSSVIDSVSGSAIANTDHLNKEQIAKRAEFYIYCRQNGLWPLEVSGHDPGEKLNWFKEFEARQNITEKYPPTMLLHGEKDTDVLFEQSVLMAEELGRHDVEYEFISEPHWEHGFDYKDEDKTVEQAHKRVLKFLDKHLGIAE